MEDEWVSLGDAAKELRKTLNSRVSKILQEGKPDGSSTNPAINYDCPKCKDQFGWMEKKAVEGYDYPVDVWKKCDCIERRKLQELFKASEITEEMQQLTFAKFKLQGRPECVRGAYETVTDYRDVFYKVRDKRKNSIYLGGEPGSGKTHLLMSLANEFMEQGIAVFYFPFVEGMDELKADMNDKEKYADKQRRMQRVPVLFIDDLFKRKKGEQPTAYEIKFMYAVINYRYLNHLPMLISSELDVNMLMYWDAAIGSRIIEMTSDFTAIMKNALDLNYRLPKGMYRV